jgi:integrase/recombinase XerD
MPPKSFQITFSKPENKWRVNIPASSSMSGKRERHFFATKPQAKAFVSAQQARLMNDGTAGATLERVERDIAAKAFYRLQQGLPESNPAELLQAVDEYVAARNRRSRSKSFKEGYEEWMSRTLNQTRKGKPTSPHYKKQMRQLLPRLGALHEMLLCDITPDDVENALKATVLPEHKAARNGMVRVLNACFKYCKERGWLDEVPVSKDSKADTGQKEPGILTPDQVLRLLATCEATDNELLGYYLLALFAGVRPTDELFKLQWNHVFADGGDRIYVPAEVSKTGRKRYVKIEPTLKAWLDYIQPPRVGPVTPMRNHVKRRRAVERAAGVVPWPRDGMRHSYASYWMTIHRDEDQCRDNMGHRTKDQLVTHYRQHTTEEEARAFWNIKPEVVLQVERLLVG